MDSKQFADEYGEAVLKLSRSPSVPAITRFTLTDRHGNETSSHSTLREAVQRKRQNYLDTGEPGGTLSAKYADGSRRILFTNVGSGYWHFTPNGRAVNDDQVTRTGRGKTHHAYLAKDDPRFTTLAHVHTIADELFPGNFTGDAKDVDPEVWKHVAAASDEAYRKEDLTPFAQLYDYLGEHYGHQEAMEPVLNHLRGMLNQAGIKF